MQLLTWPESDTVKQQSITDWHMIGFSHYRTVWDGSHQERLTHRVSHW